MRSILYVVNDFHYWKHHRSSLAFFAQKKGYKITVATDNIPEAVGALENGIEFVHMPIARFNLSFSDILFFFKLRNKITKNNYSIVHLITIKSILIGGLVLASVPSNNRPKTIGTVPGLGRLFTMRRLFQKIIVFALRPFGKTAAAATFENYFDADWYRVRKIVENDKIHVLKGAGVDLSIFSIKEKCDNKTIRFLFSSRLLKSKGVLEFFSAAQRLKPLYGDRVKFSIAGYANSEPDALTDEQLYAISNNVSIDWLGKIPSDRMPEILQSHDVLVLPTRYPEGLPRSVLEAGACGLAVIASCCPGIQSLIRDGQDGLLLRGGDVKSVEDAMTMLIRDPGRIEELGMALRKKIIEEGYGVDEVNKSFLKIYEQN